LNTEKAVLVAKKSIDLSKKYLSEYDNELANYVLRDLEITKKVGLSDLSWAMHESSNISKNDVLYLIEKLEEYMIRLKKEEMLS